MRVRATTDITIATAQAYIACYSNSVRMIQIATSHGLKPQSPAISGDSLKGFIRYYQNHLGSLGRKKFYYRKQRQSAISE